MLCVRFPLPSFLLPPWSYCIKYHAVLFLQPLLLIADLIWEIPTGPLLSLKERSVWTPGHFLKIVSLVPSKPAEVRDAFLPSLISSFNKYRVLEMCQVLRVPYPHSPRTSDLILNCYPNEHITAVVVSVSKPETESLRESGEETSLKGGECGTPCWWGRI